MKKVLILKSSILDSNSKSNGLSDYFAAQLEGDILIRDLVESPLPYFTSDAVMATRGEPQTDEQKSLLALSNELISELNQADVLVINAPMYNFNIPAQLKSYFDFIARAGVTFRYTSEGPVGLVKGKKAIVILTTGGLHKNSSTDLVKNYLQVMLGFIGILDVKFVYAEGLAMGEQWVSQALESAKSELTCIASTL